MSTGMDVFMALADPQRRRMIELLAQAPQAAGAIAACFTISGPAVSQHLKVLRETRLVQVRIEGQRRIYSLDPEGMGALDDWIARTRTSWATRLHRLETLLEEEKQG